MLKFEYMKQIIINADDFGIHTDANHAIVDLFLKKTVSAASLMMNTGQSIAEAIALVKHYKIPVALHFNLTLQNPRFKNRGDFERQYFFRRVPALYIKEELEQQYNYLVRQGIIPTNIDSHQHIHNWPGIFRIVAIFAKTKNIPLRIPEEWPIFNKYDRIRLTDLKFIFRKMIFLVFSKINKIQARLLGVKTNCDLVSFFSLWPRPVKFTEKHLELLLSKVKNNTDYMCHPAVSAENMKGLTSISDISVQEYNLMTKDSFLAMIKKYDLELINYKEIA